MFLPIRTERPLKRPTVTTIALIVITVIAYAVQSLVAGPQVDPDRANQIMGALTLDPLQPRWWTFITYQFLHGHLLHLGGNMLFLWVFGPPVEDKLGRWWFPAFYLVGGAFAGAMHALAEPNPVIGASGSIAAVTGAFLVFFPRVHIRVLLLFFLIGIFQIPAIWFILLAISWDIFLPRGNVAVTAHLGGYAFGISIAFALLAFKLVSREPYDLFTIFKQANRRRVFRDATARHGSAYAGDAATRMAKPKREDPASQRLAGLRADVVRAVNDGDGARAAAAYRKLLDETKDGALARPSQLALANLLYAAGETSAAVSAYEHFLAKYATDPEAPRVRLMLGLIHARTLNDPVRAKALVNEARPRLRSIEEQQLAEELLEELG